MTKAIYCIKDSNGRYEGSLNICSSSLEKPNSDWKWDYHCQIYPMSGNLGREGAELKVHKLREINKLAGFELDWQVVEFNNSEWENIRTEQLKEYEETGKNPLLYWSYNSVIEHRDIAKGCITKHRKLVREIVKKYKLPNRAVVA